MNNVMEEILKMIKNPWRIFLVIRRLGNGLPWMSDLLYLKLSYLGKTGKKLNLVHPQSFNEKLQYLKLYNRKSEYTRMVDKYEAKLYVASIIGEEHIIPTYGVWNSFSEIDFDNLPQSFVLKCTHNCGVIVICKDKSELVMTDVESKINHCLKKNYYYWEREWPYKNVKPRIICEQLMETPSGGELVDYKIFCFDGVPRIILTVHGGHTDESKITRRMYDTNWNLLKVGLHGKKFVDEPELKPEKLDEMLALAKKLSCGLKHIRVDLYNIGQKIYFGELTFFHMGGFEIFKPDSFNQMLGDYINL